MPGLEMWGCDQLAVPTDVMEHVVRVESSFNPWAIGVVGARLERQPRSLDEAVATARVLERQGYDFSVGLAQVNRRNLAAQDLHTWEAAFEPCRNLAAGARILADCVARADGGLGRGLSCYYSGNFTRGFQDGYVDKVLGSMAAAGAWPGSIGLTPSGPPVRIAEDTPWRPTRGPGPAVSTPPAMPSTGSPESPPSDPAFVF